MLRTPHIGAGAAIAPFASSPRLSRPRLLATVDTDKDGTIDLNEAKTAAGAVFDKLDADHDGTLDKKELKGRIAKKDWADRRSRQRQDNQQGRISRLCRDVVQGRR